MANLSVPDPEDDKKLQLTDLGDRSHDNTLEDVAVSLESTPDQQQQQHDSSWSPFSKKHHHHHDEDDRFTSASTVYHHQIKRFGAIKKFWSRAMGDIYADDNPREYSRLKKNIIITIVAFSGISGPLGSMIYMPGLTQIQASLHTSTAAVNGSVSAYVVFMGIAVTYTNFIMIHDCIVLISFVL